MIISFEGIDGAGKTTAINEINAYLDEWHFLTERVVISEMGTKFGAGLKPLLMTVNSAAKQLPIVNTARLHAWLNIAMPVLQKKGIVIYDRFIHSTLAYQGAFGLSPDYIRNFHAALDLPMPDVVFYFDIDFEILKSRLAKRGDTDTFDNQSLSMFETIVGHFKKQCVADGAVIIDANKKPKHVRNQVLTHLQALLEN